MGDNVEAGRVELLDKNSRANLAEDFNISGDSPLVKEAADRASLMAEEYAAYLAAKANGEEYTLTAEREALLKANDISTDIGRNMAEFAEANGLENANQVANVAATAILAGGQGAAMEYFSDNDTVLTGNGTDVSNLIDRRISAEIDLLISREETLKAIAENRAAEAEKDPRVEEMKAALSDAAASKKESFPELSDDQMTALAEAYVDANISTQQAAADVLNIDNPEYGTRLSDALKHMGVEQTSPGEADPTTSPEAAASNQTDAQAALARNDALQAMEVVAAEISDEYGINTRAGKLLDRFEEEMGRPATVAEVNELREASPEELANAGLISEARADRIERQEVREDYRAEIDRINDAKDGPYPEEYTAKAQARLDRDEALADLAAEDKREKLEERSEREDDRAEIAAVRKEFGEEMREKGYEPGEEEYVAANKEKRAELDELRTIQAQADRIDDSGDTAAFEEATGRDISKDEIEVAIRNEMQENITQEGMGREEALTAAVAEVEAAIDSGNELIANNPDMEPEMRELLSQPGVMDDLADLASRLQGGQNVASNDGPSAGMSDEVAQQNAQPKPEGPSGPA